MTQQKWAPDGVYDRARKKVLLHGLTGAAVAALSSGGDIRGAATGAAGSELTKGAMIRFLTGQSLDPHSSEFNSLVEIASAVLGHLIIGGSDGAANALL